MKTMKLGYVCLLGVGLVACGDDKSSAKGGGSPDGGGGSGAGTADARGDAMPVPEGAKLKWWVSEISDLTPAPTLAGVDVCVHEHAEIPCVKTDADGVFELAGLPRDTALDVTFLKDGYIPTLKTIETSNIDMDATGQPPVSMATDAPAPTDFGFTVDTTKGVLSFFVIGPQGDGGFGPLPGATATLSPDEGDGPIFFTGANKYDLTAKTTVAFGGNFYNLNEGEYKVTVSSKGNVCAGISFPFSGWGIPVSGEQAVLAHVLPGYLTWSVGTFCTPSPDAPDAGSTPDAGVGPSDAGDAASD